MDIDLEPHEWRTAPRPGAPFFGPGLPGWLAYMVGLTASAIASYWLLHH